MISDELYDRTPLARHENNSLSKILEQLPSEGRILDVGCATGKLGEYLQLHSHCQVDGIEQNIESAELAKNHYRTVYSFDVEDLSGWETLEEPYDVIVLADILEHLKTPESVIKHLMNHLLKPTGKLLISLPNVGHVSVIYQLLNQTFQYHPGGLLDKTHLRFFSRHNLSALFDSLEAVTWRIIDTVSIGFQGTELRESLQKSIPPEWLMPLSKLPDGNTYQFIIEVKALQSDEVGITQAQAKRPNDSMPSLFISPTVFYQKSEDDVYTAENILSQSIGLTEEIISLTYTLPSNLQKLRFDPADIPGMVRIHQVQLKDASETTIWQLNASAEINTQSAAIQIAWDKETNCMIVKMDDFDAWFELPIPNGILPLAKTLEIQMEWPKTHDYFLLSKRYDERLQQMKQAHLETEQQLSAFVAEKEALQNELHNLRQQLAESDQECNDLKAQLEDCYNTLNQYAGCRKLFSFYQKLKNFFYRLTKRNAKK